MQSLQHTIMRRIEAALNEISLAGLVAIFTTRRSDDALLVYLDVQPDSRREQMGAWQAVSLDSLTRDLYKDYDGPMVGLDALDVLFDNIPVHGVNFRSLDVIVRGRAKRVQLRDTAWDLAQYLATRSYETPAARARAQRKIVSLRLTKWLDEMGEKETLPGLVALQGEEVFVANPAAPRTVYLDGGSFRVAPALEPSACWTAAYDEMGLLDSAGISQLRDGVDLRATLRRIGRSDAVAATCRGLASWCWHAHQCEQFERQATGDQPVARPQTEQTPPLCRMAYELAAESWLAAEEADDLVAVIPAVDFTTFLEKGQYTRVLRVPPPKANRDASATLPAAPDEVALVDVLEGKVSMCDGRGPVLALPALEGALGGLGARNLIDLGPVLFKAGHNHALARTFWLLSRDFLRRPEPPAWQRLNVPSGIVSQLARRAALIYGLEDPWSWRQGRYSDLLQDLYDYLRKCLEAEQAQAGSSPTARFLAGLASWYGCAQATDVLERLSGAMDLQRAFEEAEELRGGEGESVSINETARRFIAAGTRLLHPGSEVEATAAPAPPVAGQIATLLREAADDACPIPEPTPIFIQRSLEYLLLYQESRGIQEQLAQGLDVESLSSVRDRLSGLRRSLHAPVHEQRMLEEAIDGAVGQIDGLLRATQSGPVIVIGLRGPQPSLNTRQKLVFELGNEGTRAATDFELTLRNYQGLELEQGVASFKLPLLKPSDRPRVELEARLLEPAAMLQFVYQYFDDQHRLIRDQQRVLLSATNETVTYGRLNAFEAGRPVSGAGAFFGRQTELTQILSRLAAKDSTAPLALRGPRRIGKSSLLREIEFILNRPPEELRSEKDRREEDVAATLPPEILAGVSNMRAVRASLQSMFEATTIDLALFLRGLLRDVCLRIDQPPAGAEAAFEREKDQIGVARAFVQELDAVLDARPDLRLVVLLDELDPMFNAKAIETAGQLRYIIETCQRVTWITASTRLVQSAVGTFGSPWFNLLVPMEIRELDWGAAERLVRVLGGQAGCEWPTAAMAALLERTGRRPYLVQLVGARVTDALVATGRERVEVADVAAAINRLIDDAAASGAHLGYVWNEAGPFGQLILWVMQQATGPLKTIEIARAIRATGLAMSESAFQNTLKDSLVWLTSTADVLEQRSGLYSFAYPIVKRLVERIVEHDEHFIAYTIEHLTTQAGVKP